MTAGVGAGYEVFENSWFYWEVGLGAGYQYTSYDSVLPGQADTAHDAVAVPTTKVNFDLPHGIDWDKSYKLNLVVTDISETNHHAESVLSFDVWGPLDIKLSLIFDRIEEPVPNSDGVRPESNDLRLTAGLGLSF